MQRWIRRVVPTAFFIYLIGHWQRNKTSSTYDATSSKLQATAAPKIILFWTGMFHKVDFDFGFGGEPFKSCPVSNCRTTNQRQLLSHSDAIIFHPWNVNLNDLPQIRKPEQRWIFYLLESPIYSPAIIANISDRFNWTMTFRTDSDIVRLYSDTMQDWPLHENHDEVRLRLRNKKKSIAWFVSNCHSYSGREAYVKELEKHISVDIYGQCGPLKCANKTSRNECFPMLASDYKFYLAFENSICVDYVTEKLYNALSNFVIPIVNGGADYSQFAPKDSFIHIRDFESPKHLADYLNYLDKNQTAYEEYFEWRKKYVPKKTSGWCKLCELLNNSTSVNFFHSNVREWWSYKGACNGKQPMNTSHPEISFIWKNRSEVIQ